MPHANQIFWTITTQEEIGLRGAHTAVEVVKPDVGIAIEGGITGDVFPGRPDETQVKLGSRARAVPVRLVGAAEPAGSSNSCARRRRAKLPLQLDLVQGYGDDSAELQKALGGVPTVNLVVPVRYTHSHNGIINRRDFDQTVDLLVALIQKLDAAQVQRLKDFTPE